MEVLIEFSVMGGYTMSRGRLESLLQHSTEIEIHKNEPELKKKTLRSVYPDYKEWRNM